MDRCHYLLVPVVVIPLFPNVLISLADSSCAFSAQGSGSGTIVINSNPIVFEQVDLNVCDGYDVTTGR